MRPSLTSPVRSAFAHPLILAALVIAALPFCAAAQAAATVDAAAATVAAEMRARGVPPSEVVVSFAADERIVAFAQAAVAAEPAADATARARILYDAVLALKRRGAIASDLENAPKARPPKTASALLAAALAPAGGGGAREAALARQAGCYELTALYLALARSVGLPAVAVKSRRVSGTGQIGHVLAALLPASAAAERAAMPVAAVRVATPVAIFDLQNERVDRVPAGVQVMTDLELAALHFSHLAVAAYLSGDLRRAATLVHWALLLSPDAPELLANQANILAAEGELDLAIADALQATELGPEVPVYHYTLGRLLLTRQELAAARSALMQAVRLHPGYGLARRDLGWTELLLGDDAAAERELTAALRLPPTPDGELYLGLFRLARGRRAEALALAQQALATKAGDPALLALAALALGTPPPAAARAEAERLTQLLATVASRDKAR